MGTVTDYLKNLIAEQVERHRLVVWFDPEQHYSEVVNTLDLQDTTVACYDGSFLDLRRRLSSSLEGLEPPRLVVYVPMNEEESQDALVELTVSGVVIKPGQHPWQRNTRLSVISRNALRSVIGDDAINSIEKQVDAGQLCLRDLDRLVQEGGKGVVSIVFGTGDPKDIALTFLSIDNESRQFQEILKRNAMSELSSLLSEAFDAQLPVEPEACQSHLARHILSTAFITDLAGDIPGPLATISVAEGESARRACLDVAKNWRSRSDTRENYVQWALKVEKEIGLASVSFTREQISSTEAFLTVEEALQKMVEQELLTGATQVLVDLARTRQSGFWAEQIPEVQARWALIAIAGQLLMEATRVEKEMKSGGAVADLVHSYASGESPWCLLDTYHRHMERQFQNVDFLGEGHLEALEKLVVRARQSYTKTGDELARRFAAALEESKFNVPGVPCQLSVYTSEVAPLVEEHKTAYILVDALRFEMGRELASGLSKDFHVELKYAMAAVPTITEVGMAALMPRADQGAILVPADKGRLALKIGDHTLKDRASRVQYFTEQVGVPVFEAHLDDLLMLHKKTKEAITRAKLILVTSQEIDDICESGKILAARRMMDDITYLLQKACRTLAGFGVGSIVLVADHGHLFGEEISSDVKIDPPGGETIDLHRRVWVGRGGSTSHAFLRARVADFGLDKAGYDSDAPLEIAVPQGFGVFKVQGGSRAYFHGGISPQELIVPIIKLLPKAHPEADLSGTIRWQMIPGSKKISTRFFSVQICGYVLTLFDMSLPKVRVEIRAGKEVISIPVSAAYGFEDATGAVDMRISRKDSTIEPNTVALMITKVPHQRRVTVHLIDAISGREICRLDDIDVAITI